MFLEVLINLQLCTSEYRSGPAHVLKTACKQAGFLTDLDAEPVLGAIVV
jgi:hypothetical protein